MATLDVDGLINRLEQLGLGPIPQFPEAQVLKRPLDIGRSYLADILSSLIDCDRALAYESIQWPNDIFTADLAVPLPKLIRDKERDPKEPANNLIEGVPNCALFSKPLQIGVQLRVMFKPDTLPRLLLSYIHDRNDQYGIDAAVDLNDVSRPDQGRQKVVVEFSSPNIASEFHSKHLRSTIIGAFVANLYESMGWDAIRINYLGDWGKQIGLLGAGWTRFGLEAEFQEDPIGHMLSVYSKIDELFQPEVAASRAVREANREAGDNKKEDTATIEDHGLFAERNEFFKKMEDGDDQALKLWKRFRDASIEYYIKLYSSMNVRFDEYSGESQVKPETMDEIEEMLKAKGLSEEAEGAWVVDLTKHGEKSGRVIIRDRNGSRTYPLRELAAILDRYRKYSFDKMLYVVADDHNTHFLRSKKILELLDMSILAHKLQHVSFNKGYHASEKTEKDQMLGDIIEKCKVAVQGSLKEHPAKAKLLGSSKESTSKLGVSAILAQELTAKRASDHQFDIERMTKFERASGPELQYWYAKLCAILHANNVGTIEISDEDYASIESDDYLDLLRILAEYPDITTSAYRSLEPSTVMLYLIGITDQLDVCFFEKEYEEGDNEEIGGEVDGEVGKKQCSEEADMNPAEVALFEAARQVLENGMKLLGIVPINVNLSNGMNGAHI